MLIGLNPKTLNTINPYTPSPKPTILSLAQELLAYKGLGQSGPHGQPPCILL